MLFARNLLLSSCLVLLVGSCISNPTWANTAIAPIQTITASSASSVYKLARGTLPVPPSSGDVLTNQKKYFKVDAGSSFVCGIRQIDRGLDCWGLNDFGQTTAPKGRFKQLSLGEMHGCAIRLDNRLVCWGNAGARPNLEQAKGHYLQVSSGDSHTCAIKKNSLAITCWGENKYGQAMAPAGRFKQVSARNNQACAITTKKTLLCWGEDAFTKFARPIGEFIDISVGKLHGCAVRDADRSMVCWGNNQFGILAVPIGIRFNEVSSGDYHSCGTAKDDNRLVCWGRDQWGQVSQVPAVPIKSEGLGGALTCITNAKRNIICRGSYAYNDVMFGVAGPVLAAENLDPHATKSDNKDGLVSKTGIWGIVEKGVGYGLKAWGESMEAGSSGQKFVLFAAGLLGAKSDSNKARFEEIQVQLKEVQQQLKGIDKQVKETYAAVQQLSCQTAMAELKTYRETIDSAHDGYQTLVGGVLTDLTHQQQGLSPDMTLVLEIDRYATVWDDPLKSQLRDVLRNTHRFLVGNESPFIKCMNADLEAWRKAATHPFDDRNIYKGVYDVQELSEMMQLEAAIILQDINARRAIKALRDPVFARQPDAPAIDQSLVPDTGLCGEARRQKASFAGGLIPLEKARWVYAAEYCDDSSVIVKNTYKRLVQQIEFAGAPYTTDSVVVSLSGKVFGHGNSTNNWLWINWGKVAPKEVTFLHEQDFPVRPNNWDFVRYYIGIHFKNGGDANWYSDNRNKTGLWQGASDAWLELYASFDSYLKARNKKGDLLDMMSKTETRWVNKQGTDIQVMPFAKITDRPLWISNKKYDMEWNRIVGDNETDLITKDVRCFMAAGINPGFYFSSGGSRNPRETLNLTGKVCNSEELSAMARKNSPDLYGNGPYTRNWADDDKFYKKYENELGQWIFYKQPLENSWRPGWQDAKFFWDGPLMHYPVVNLAQRTCEPVLVNQGVAEDPVIPLRSNMIVRGDGVEIPTRCGKDMDKFIEDRVPRPLLPVIPSEEVRQPIY